MSPFWSAVVWTVGISIVELAAIVVVAKHFWNIRTEVRLVSFAAGVLLATVFLDLLPEAVNGIEDATGILACALFAMVALFFIERFTRRDHTHSHRDEGHETHGHQHASRYFIFFGDGLHSAIDGFAIATAFIADTTLGVVTALAVLAHEVPHQIGDFSILVRRGMSKRKALLINLTSAAAALGGVILAFLFMSAILDHLRLFIAATAGMLLYIAAVALLPELLHGRTKGKYLYHVPFLSGIVLISLLVTLLAE